MGERLRKDARRSPRAAVSVATLRSRNALRTARASSICHGAYTREVVTLTIVGSIDRIRHASQILLSVIMPTRDRVGSSRVDIALLVGVKPRSSARARTVVIPSAVGLDPAMMPTPIGEDAPQTRPRGLSIAFALLLVALAVMAFIVTRALV